jgi:protein-disulfide isomerase
MGRGKNRKSSKQRRKIQRRNTTIVIAVIALAVAGLAILVTRPVEVQVDDVLLGRYAGVPSSTTDRGFPILGNPEAPARLVEYSSFACPACADFHNEVTRNIVDRIRAGEMSLTYVPVILNGESDRAVKAALCAADQGFFWEYHDLLFNWQEVYSATAFQSSRLEAGAEALGMDVGQFNTCRRGNVPEITMDNAQAAFRASGGTGTPTIELNGERLAPPYSLAAVGSQIDFIMQTAQPVPVEVIEDEALAEDADTEAADSDAADEAAESTEATAAEADAAATEAVEADDENEADEDEEQADEAEADEEAAVDAESDATDEAE